ncbi:transglycosylase SLT domain-containing protein [Amycolatopsis rhizosphaerae]|nr:transglycosylase SLT domain-containing protein [Amycolatopsis rhizosphaerae]
MGLRSLNTVRHLPWCAAASRRLGRLGARTSVSAGLVAVSIAGAASPLAFAGSGGDTASPAREVKAVAAASSEGPELGSPKDWHGPSVRYGVDGLGDEPAPSGGDGEEHAAAPREPAREAQPEPRPDQTGDEMAGWINESLKIMRGQGVPIANEDAPGIRKVIEKESGGDPYAVNQWDSNARAGHPSKGLMQTVDSTFQAYKLSGHDNIYDPVDNIIAGVRYTINRYGGFSSHPGLKSLNSGSGYRGY